MTTDPFDDDRDGFGPAQRAALDAVLAVPAPGADDLDRLHRRILEAAEPTLAGMRAAARAEARSAAAARSRWYAATLPLAAAAALLLVVGLPGERRPRLSAEDAALLADVPDHEFSRLVSGQADAAALLMLAVGDDADDQR